MFDAIDIATGERFQFRSLETLQRRYRGTSYQLEHDGTFDPPMRTVQILRYNRKAGGFDILASVRVPTGAINPKRPAPRRGHADATGGYPLDEYGAPDWY